ncbi:MAG TPA: hemerythrin domain-containing protein [Elusimicrobiota bacterium]|nr:hemerythrin domain-containing protein [Elusimicrobiota bacterium]
MGPIGRFLTADHERLDGLLARSLTGAEVDLATFGELREGLLRHIGMEETILLPALHGLPGAPLELANKLRTDHAALANLFMPRPTPEIVRAVRFILKGHNPLEEKAGGFYDACDRLLADRAEDLTDRMRKAPRVPLRDYSERPQALAAAKRAMSRAGYSWDDCIRPEGQQS